MKFKLYKLTNNDNGFRYVTRDEDGNCLAFGYTVKGIIKSTKRKLGYSEKLIATYETDN